MTREEELDWLCRLRSEIYVYMPKEWLIPMNHALDMAISALENHDKMMKVAYEQGKKDARQTGKWIRTETIHKCYARDDTYTTWAYNCSVCGARPLAKYASDLADDELSNYCPNCGARMVDPQESEE